MFEAFNIFKLKNKISKIILLSCFALIAIFSSFNVFAADADANRVCPKQDISDKQYDESECESDSKCAGGAGCIDVSPVGKVNRVSSSFGYREHPVTGKWTGHKGVDYAADYGTPVYAAADGVIQERRYQFNASSGTGWGNMILIKHDSPEGSQTRYAHLACFADGISVGSRVTKGQLIGFVGNTGGSTGAHLHFEILDNGQAVDPFAEDNEAACTVDDALKSMDDDAKAGGSGGGGGPYGNAGSSMGAGTSSPPTFPHKDKDCFPTIFKKALSECLFCSLFLTAFNVASAVAAKTFVILAKPVIVVVAVGFGLWIAVKLLGFLSAVENKDTPTFVRQLLNQTFLVVIVIVFLSGTSVDFMAMALEPIFNTGFKLARLTMSGDFICTETFGLDDTPDEDLISQGLPASMGISIICTIKVIQEKLVDVMTMGSTSICVALHIRNFWIFPHLGFFLSGVAIWVAALLLLFIFPFLMLDAVLQLAVACALLPAAMGAFTFKITRGYVTKVWESFLSSMFHFVFLTIVMMILVVMIEKTMGESISDALKEEAINQGLWEAILEDLSWTGVTFMQLIFVFLLGWAVLGEIAKFASRFASTVSDTNIGSQIGTLAASGATNATKKIGAPIISGITGGIKSGASNIGGVAKEGITEIMNNRRSQKLASGGYSGRRDYTESVDDEGNKTYSYRTRGLSTLGRFKNVTSTVDKDGKIIAQDKAQSSIVGGKSTKTTDMGGIKLKSKINKRGEEISRDFVLPSNSRVLTGGGKLNKSTQNMIAQNPALNENLKNEVLLMSAMKERMPGQMETLVRINTVKDQGTVVRNEDGSLQITKIDTDGMTHTFSMNVDAESGQVLTTYSQISKPNKNGERDIKTMFSNGVVDKVSQNKIDANGKAIPGTSAKPKYAVRAGYTKNKNSMPIDYYGKLAGYMPDEKTTFAGMSESDVARIKKRYKETRSNEQLDEFGNLKSKDNVFTKWSTWLNNKGKAILQVDDEYIGLSEEEVEQIKERKRRDGGE